MLMIFAQINNDVANAYWEARLKSSDKPNSNTPDSAVDQYINNKYVSRRYADTSVRDPVSRILAGESLIRRVEEVKQTPAPATAPTQPSIDLFAKQNGHNNAPPVQVPVQTQNQGPQPQRVQDIPDLIGESSAPTQEFQAFQSAEQNTLADLDFTGQAHPTSNNSRQPTSQQPQQQVFQEQVQQQQQRKQQLEQQPAGVYNKQQQVQQQQQQQQNMMYKQQPQFQVQYQYQQQACPGMQKDVTSAILGMYNQQPVQQTQQAEKKFVPLGAIAAQNMQSAQFYQQQYYYQQQWPQYR